MLSLPNLFSSLVEPVLGILGDMWKRRALVLGGGAAFALAALFTALSQSFAPLLLSFMLFNPASGAFVSLSQASLMDFDPDRREQNMARWTFAGSVGVVAGPLLLSAAVALGPGWRGLFFGFAALKLLTLLAARRQPFPNGATHSPNPSPDKAGFRAGIVNALRALRRREVLHWLTLLAFSDLMLDVLLGFLALYFVDVVGVTETQAGLAVAVWTGVGLVGDLLLIPLLERVRGLSYLRVSAAAMLFLFPAFLLTPGVEAKLILLGLLGLLNSGWYAILQAQVYAAMPGQSGTVMAVDNIFGIAESLIPLGLGVVAQQYGLSVAMWLLLAGPAALLVGLPRRK